MINNLLISFSFKEIENTPTDSCLMSPGDAMTQDYSPPGDACMDPNAYSNVPFPSGHPQNKVKVTRDSSAVMNSSYNKQPPGRYQEDQNNFRADQPPAKPVNPKDVLQSEQESPTESNDKTLQQPVCQSPDSSANSVTTSLSSTSSLNAQSSVEASSLMSKTKDSFSKKVSTTVITSDASSTEGQRSSHQPHSELLTSSPLETLQQNPAIAATIANLLKLNSCTITSAAASSSPSSREESPSKSPSPSLTPQQGMSRNSSSVSDTLREVKLSPQVPSINSTTNVPLTPPNKHTEKLPNSISRTANLTKSRGDVGTNDAISSSPATSSISPKPLPDALKKERTDKESVTRQVKSNFKNNADVKRSIASALPLLSASMAIKDVGYMNEAQPLKSESSKTLPRANDADLSVAKDLILLSQSHLFPQNSFLNNSVTSVSVTSTNNVENEFLPGPSSDDGSVVSVASVTAPKASTSSSSRSNSNSPNPPSRHVLCQMVPAQSQSKTATARAKPQAIASHNSFSIKAEVSSDSSHFSIGSDDGGTDSEPPIFECDNKNTRNGSGVEQLPNKNPISASPVTSNQKKRGRPPKQKETIKTSSPLSGKDSNQTENSPRTNSKNVKGIGESDIPNTKTSLIHQCKLKNKEEKLQTPKKLSPSELKESKLSFGNLDLKKSLVVKTDSVMPKIKPEKVSPNSAFSNDNKNLSLKLVNGENLTSSTSSSPGTVKKLESSPTLNSQISQSKNQIPSSEEIKFVFTEHSKNDGNKFKPGTSKKLSDDSKSSKSDSGSSREGSNPPSKTTKSSKYSAKGSTKAGKLGKNSKKSSAESKSRMKKSLLAYLKEKNDSDSSNIDSDAPVSSQADPSSSSPSTSEVSSEGTKKEGEKSPGPSTFPTAFTSKSLRRRQSSVCSKGGKVVKKPKWIHGWRWEGEPYQGKVWLRVRYWPIRKLVKNEEISLKLKFGLFKNLKLFLRKFY